MMWATSRARCACGTAWARPTAQAQFGASSRWRPGRRVGVSDLVADDQADAATVAEWATSVRATPE